MVEEHPHERRRELCARCRDLRDVLQDDAPQRLHDGEPRLEHLRQIVHDGLCKTVHDLPRDPADPWEPLLDAACEGRQERCAQVPHVHRSLTDALHERQSGLERGAGDVRRVIGEPLCERCEERCSELCQRRDIAREGRDGVPKDIPDLCRKAIQTALLEGVSQRRDILPAELHQLPQRRVHAVIDGDAERLRLRSEGLHVSLERVVHGLRHLGHRAVTVVQRRLQASQLVPAAGHERLCGGEVGLVEDVAEDGRGVSIAHPVHRRL